MRVPGMRRQRTRCPHCQREVIVNSVEITGPDGRVETRVLRTIEMDFITLHTCPDSKEHKTTITPETEGGERGDRK